MIVLHRGKCGDLIALCAWLREKHSEEKAQVYIKPHSCFSEQDVKWITPLLSFQPCINKVGIYQTPEELGLYDIPNSIQKARQAAQKGIYTGQHVMNASWWEQTKQNRKTVQLRDRFSLWYQNTEIKSQNPWLQLPELPRPVQDPYILINITSRYRCLTDISCIKEFSKQYKIIFAGKQEDYNAYAKNFSEFFPVSSSIDLANLVKHAQLCVAGQSLVFWLAQSLGVNRILCSSACFFDTKMRVHKGKGKIVSTKEQLYSALYAQLSAQKLKGFIISTYGTPAYVDLQLKLHKEKWNHDCIVVDDGSHNEQLKEVCKKWNVPLLGVDDVTLGHQKGDAKVYSKGLEYFKDRTWVYKISRRFIWLKDFSRELPQSDFSQHPLLSEPFRLRSDMLNTTCSTCAIGIYNKVPASVMKMLEDMPNKVFDKKGSDFVQHSLFTCFKSSFQSPLTLWRALYPAPGQQVVAQQVLWKTKTSNTAYYNLSQELGLNWTQEDFDLEPKSVFKSQSEFSGIGFIISTYGTPAYVDLQLKLHKEKWNHDCIVVDDGSHNEQLKEVCKKWNVPLLGVDDVTLGHHPGDFKSYKLGLPYFKDKEWVIKISRRCLWSFDFSTTLNQYKDAKVLSAWQRGQHNTMTTNCIAYHLSAIPQECIQEFLSQKPAQDLLHHVENLHYQVFSKYFNPPFTHWKQVLLGQGMSLTTPACLWHRQVPFYVYYFMAKYLGLDWPLESFLL